MALENLTPTTETEALNAMLSAIGEAPVDNIDTATQADAVMGIGILRKVSKRVQLEGWEFNTELGLELAPAGTLDWLDTKGTTTTLNVFTPPAGYGRIEITPTPEQAELLLTIRPSKVYAPVGTPVFYDRALNRDGLDADAYDYLYVDVTYLFDFSDLPESARDFITAFSAMQFAQNVDGSKEVVQYTADDVSRAWRMLVRDQGDKERYNIFDGTFMREVEGLRPRRRGGFISQWGTPGYNG